MDMIHGINITIPSIEIGKNRTSSQESDVAELNPSFLDVFKQVALDAAQSDAVTTADKIRMVLGDADDLEIIQLNKDKASLSLELLVNVKNGVVEAYNELIRMQI